MQTKNDFSPEEFLTTVNPETEILYTYLRLDNGQYLFAPKSEIQSYTKPDEQNSFFGQEKLKTYKSFLKDNSLVMISHNNEFISAQQQYAELFQNVGYFIMGVSSSQKEMKFTSYLLFAKPETYTVPVFKPKFTSYLKSSTIAYIEL
ncbi:TPA: hypothetical protein DEP21_06545 [Patescibacteria group bacterium]|nr:hypothetical protein [Candidatus Gracilibacteria bacterium]